MSLDRPFDMLIYEMFFYPGIEIARHMNIPCVRQFSQPAWLQETWPDAPLVYKLSAKLIDMQVLPRSNAAAMGFEFKCLKDGIIKSRPDLNIVYIPEQFQPKRESFDDTYLFTVPVQENTPAGNIHIPYESMKRPIVYVSLGSIISRIEALVSE